MKANDDIRLRHMRDRLIHAYFDVDADVVWDTVMHNLKPLLAALDKIIPPDAGQ